MHDAGPRLPSCIRQILKMKQKAVHNRPAARSGPGMDHYPCRLFDDRQIFVLEIDLERHLLGCEWLRFKDAEINLDSLSAADLVSGFVTPAFDLDRTRAVQELNLCSRQIS